MVIAETVPQPSQNQNATTTLSSQPNDKPYMEQAADHFNAFAIQIPKVISAKLNAFRRYGFRAVLLDNPETKLIADAMIDSLVSGLRALGHALYEDLAPSTPISTEDVPVNRQPARQ